MKPIVLCALALSVTSFGCARAALAPVTAAAEAPKSPTAHATPDDDAATAATDEAATTKDEAAHESASTSARLPGDFVVYRFSGSFRKAPATLTERVIAREGDDLTLDVTVDDGASKRTLRVRMSDAPATRGEIAKVWKVEGGATKPATLDDYDALLASTTLAADANEATLGTESVKVDVAHQPVAATKTSFRVRVGSHEATLSTLESPTFAWGDLGGEIHDGAGKVLYRAEVVDAGHADVAAPAAAPIAHSDVDDSDDE